ncbi:MAG: sulfotransferase family protein [Candidatus Hydrogenedens sp.]|nr:sulfotransferase family protein [Candidatus Hydrogenedens sp.]
MTGSSGPDSRTITVVSGLPRSGTSLMMQMLAAGGMPVLTDDVRQADESNPRGYFEYDPVRWLHRDASWIGDSRGKAVKIVSPLLRFLPEGEDYRVVVVRRELEQVLCSQAAMLGEAVAPDNDLRAAYAAHLPQVEAFLATRNIPTMYVDHGALMAQPRTVAEQVIAFLGVQLDPAAMASAVDPNLYRQRRVGLGPPPDA